MNLTELRKKTNKDILKELNKMKEDTEKYAQEILKGKEKNVCKLRSMRKDCARIATVLNEKKLLKMEEKNE